MRPGVQCAVVHEPGGAVGREDTREGPEGVREDAAAGARRRVAEHGVERALDATEAVRGVTVPSRSLVARVRSAQRVAARSSSVNVTEQSAVLAAYAPREP